jgi:hypothetical protein
MRLRLLHNDAESATGPPTRANVNTAGLQLIPALTLVW